MKNVAVFLGAFFLALPLYAAEGAAGTGNGNEVPFVEGESPPPLSAGEVWCLVKKAAEYRAVTKRVETRAATFYYKKIPAVYEKRSKKVLLEPEKKRAIFVPTEFKTEQVRTLVQEASSRLEVVPAQYKWVEEEIIVKPAYEEEVLMPAKFKTVHKRMQIEPARTAWKKVDCDDEGVIIHKRESKDDCYTLIELPAQFRTVATQELLEPSKVVKRQIPAVTKTVRVKKLVTPATTRKVEIPAEYAMVDKKVVVKPAHYRYETIPAKYGTVEELVLVTPEAKEKVSVPAAYANVTHQELVEPAKLVWRKRALKGKDRVERLVAEYGSIPGAGSGD